MTQPYFLVVKQFLVHGRKCIRHQFTVLLRELRLRQGSWDWRVPQSCPQGCWAPRGSRYPVTSDWHTLERGQHCPRRCFLLPVLALVPDPESGTWMPPPSVRALPGALLPARPHRGLRGRGGEVCVLTPLSAVSLGCPRPHPVALFSLRNLSRPGLTQYELDSKSRPVAPSGHALHRDGE